MWPLLHFISTMERFYRKFQLFVWLYHLVNEYLGIFYAKSITLVNNHGIKRYSVFEFTVAV